MLDSSIEPQSQILNDDANRQDMMNDIGAVSPVVLVGLEIASGADFRGR